MDFHKKYQHYVNTKLAWVPEIPAGWHVRKLTHAIGYTVGFTPESGNPHYYGDDFPWANISDLGPRVLNETSKGITQEAVAKYRKRPTHAGSLLYSFKLSVGQVSFAGKEMFTNEAIASFSESEWIHLPYFYYLAPIAIIQNASENIYGAKILNQEAIGNAKLIIPPLDEQQTIARFLDFKTAQIDALIAKQQALLDKLAEKRTALISHAVTKGLDPSVPMKNSGVEWLGDVPIHWQVLQLKFAVTFQRGHDLPADARTEGEVPLVSSSGISSSHDVPIAKGPGIVTGRYGTIGKFTYVESDYWPLNTTLYSVNTHGNNVKYLWFMMHLLSDLFVMESKKGAVPGVDRNDLHPVLTAVPPKFEQDEIVGRLEKITSKLDQQAEQITKVIDRLQEYRSALVTNAVTGKIDVRGFQIPDSSTATEPSYA